MEPFALLKDSTQDAKGLSANTDTPNSSSNTGMSDRPRKEAVLCYHPLIASTHLMAAPYQCVVSLLKPTPTPQEFLNASSTHIKIALERLDIVKVICRAAICREITFIFSTVSCPYSWHSTEQGGS